MKPRNMRHGVLLFPLLLRALPLSAAAQDGQPRVSTPLRAAAVQQFYCMGTSPSGEQDEDDDNDNRYNDEEPGYGNGEPGSQGWIHDNRDNDEEPGYDDDALRGPTGGIDHEPEFTAESQNYYSVPGHQAIFVNAASLAACNGGPALALAAYLNVSHCTLECHLFAGRLSPSRFLPSKGWAKQWTKLWTIRNAGISPYTTNATCDTLMAALNRKLNTTAFSCKSVDTDTSDNGSNGVRLVAAAEDCNSTVGTLNRAIFNICDFFRTQYYNDATMDLGNNWSSHNCKDLTRCGLGINWSSAAPTLVNDRRCANTCALCGSGNRSTVPVTKQSCSRTENTVCVGAVTAALTASKLSGSDDAGITLTVLLVIAGAVIFLLYYRKAKENAEEATKTAGEAQRKADDPDHAMELLLGGPNANAGGGSGPTADDTGMMQRLMAKAKRICMTDITNYGLEFESVLETQAADLQSLEQHVNRIKKGLPKEEPRQPSWRTPIDGADDTTDPRYYDDLKRWFQAEDGTIFDSVRAVAAGILGLVFKPGPSKKDGRANDKVDICYADDYAMLKDLRRASIVCADVATIIALLLALEAAGIDIRRIKNRFDRKYNAAEKSAGYRDLQLNICIPGIGLIWELQIHLEAIEKLKTEMSTTPDATNRTGHQRYVAFRDIMERLVAMQKRGSVSRSGGSQAVQETNLSSTAYAEA